MSDCNRTTHEAARLRDKLTGALIGLARAADGSEHLITDASTALIMEGLRATLPDEPEIAILEQLLLRAEAEKRNMVPNCFTCACPCGRTSDYDMGALQNEQEDVRDLKLRILDRIRILAACISPAPQDSAVHTLLYRALFVIGLEGCTAESLLPILSESEEMQWKLAPV